MSGLMKQLDSIKAKKIADKLPAYKVLELHLQAIMRDHAKSEMESGRPCPFCDCRRAK
jgi:hypothetical protein